MGVKSKLSEIDNKLQNKKDLLGIDKYFLFLYKYRNICFQRNTLMFEFIPLLAFFFFVSILAEFFIL